ncbi:proton-conducting transporter membrane subunit [Rhodopila sp.]|uniref:proton-conducting transporter transmembrane domain-containing protein n=1 Tax=Rhodopila sp. TaxID=2480087 RepID=UPI003D148B6F
MTDPILMFMIIDAAALLVLCILTAVVPNPVAGLAATGLSGLGMLLCLPPLLSRAAATMLTLPVGPPGLSLHLTLDPVSVFFLLIIFACGTAVAAFAEAGDAVAATKLTQAILLCLAGLSLAVLASDAVTLSIGLSLAGAGLWRMESKTGPVRLAPPGGPALAIAPLAAVFLLLAAVCLLAPAGFAPRFDAIRAAPIEPGKATAAAALALAASLGLLTHRRVPHHWALEALMAGAVMPCAIYLLIRLALDLPGSAAQPWWGFVLLLAGGAMSVAYGWQAVRQPDLNGSVGCLTRRQMGLAVVGLGLTQIARASDLPDAASFGLAAVLLLTLGNAAAGTLAVLAAHALEAGAATVRLARLGGLVQTMPIASAALASALLAQSALPLAAGFASLWLLLQSILAAPRTGGLICQLPLALTAAAVALSAALATAAAVRLVGIVVLSRPRSVRGSAAKDVGFSLRPILLTLSAVSLLIGVLPGLALRLLADPMIRTLTGTGLGARAGLLTLSASAESPGYAPLPVLAMLGLATGVVILIVRRFRKQTRIAAVWSDGIAPSPTLPFGDPVAQSVGTGFLPTVPNIWPQLPPMSFLPPPRLSRAVMAVKGLGLWAILLAFGVLLLVLSLLDASGPWRVPSELPWRLPGA